jgi:hypothetical protein
VVTVGVGHRRRSGTARAPGQGVDQVALDGRVERHLAAHHRLEGLADLLGPGVLALTSGAVTVLVGVLAYHARVFTPGG